MVKSILLALFVGLGVMVCAQQKSFWKEDFSSGKLPNGWIIVDSTGAEGHTYEWMLTDQPYPGSFQFEQQAPPIASVSRGYHMQYRPGVFTGEEITKWNQKKQYPQGYFQTAAIDCRNKKDVVLKFQHVFRWNDWFTKKGKGLWVGVSNDGKTWKEYDVLGGRPASTNMHEPITEEINISEIAAEQEKVYIRFFWKGIFSWYWMVDDIELTEPYAQDIALLNLDSHRSEGNEFTAHDTLKVRIKNMGSQSVNEDFDVRALFNDGRQLKATVKASVKPLEKQEERLLVFPPVDLTQQGSHKITFEILYAKDQRKDNDVLNVHLYAAKMSLGKVTGFKKLNKHEFEFVSGYAKVKLMFYRDDIFRIWLAQDNEYTNPAADAIVVDYSVKNPKVAVSENGHYYKFATPQCVVRVYKNPLRFAMYDKDDRKMLFEEKEPISFGSKTSQMLKRGGKEYFYGGGMQQGRFSHAGTELDIAVTGWQEGEASNPAPFYMSSNGYGVFRNTFAQGKYAFNGEETKPTEEGMKTAYFSTLTHDENRFDAFYFYGPGLKDILGDYTTMTGKPFMPAQWMLTMGDADCYNKPEQRVGWKQQTPDVITQIADKYVEHDMPRGWILPNDGYGCGYVKLDSVVKELKKRGFYTGLWTENGVDKIAYEVGTCGTRLCKLDVAWVGAGYEFALNGTKAAYEGIQNNTNERGFVWSVCGWAGTQRYSTVWSGDQVGDFDYIRYHIPTVTGAGLSAFNAATSDIDGIFGGSAFTYTRDLQWKVFTPIIMTMSGWAPVDKQPWLYGHPYEEINRNYLKLKMRLMPYAYTYCRQAHETGVPMVRAMVLEFPQDEVTYDTATQYQFMSGEWMMVAPVYKRGDWRGTCQRENIYFPAGTWYDYWTGEAYEGGKWLDKYKASLATCPVFVREGAIIPMYPDMNYVWEKPADVLTLDLYPFGQTSFDMYEDDGLTRDFENGKFARTLISVSAPTDKKGNVTVTIGKARGDYEGRLKERVYVLQVKAEEAPVEILHNGKSLPAVSVGEFEEGKIGWCFNPEEKKGRIHVRTEKVSTDKEQVLQICY
ncbi:TIM-barrel domain-containing protein [Odoribacter lunatus]|uniref:glycoside hydrolase family 31 protein n=1 Tax=Odoribacter lunatus TaxID=2941335 RepID=UPI00203D9D3D|nr:TIM-barrel domain-containing protein [Odoribacter lunatus]